MKVKNFCFLDKTLEQLKKLLISVKDALKNRKMDISVIKINMTN